ncbi:cupin-like domain-containing protein [Sphingomonas sp. RS6]
MAERDPGIFEAMPCVREVVAGDAGALDAELRAAREPIVLRGLVADWPLVAAARDGGAAARAYLLRYSRDVPFAVSVGTAGTDGRLFYEGDATSMNFRSYRGPLAKIFGQIDQVETMDDPPPIYLGSIDVQRFFDGLDTANPLDLGGRDAPPRIWIGTRTRIAAHNDVPANLACVAAGRRRFTLFPPEQFRNLYLGPLDHTPAGRSISMVDFHAPDFARFPRFREALAHARTVELAPGDALHIPPLWWHHVEGLDRFNILVNYWWRETPGFLGDPQDALNHAILAIRDLPAEERRYWQDVFDHYVFSGGDDAAAHVPPPARSVLAPLTRETAGRIRAFLLRQLTR